MMDHTPLPRAAATSHCDRFGHEWDRGTCTGCGAGTHFRVPAREMLFDEPATCPHYGALSFDGIAVTPADQIHLIMRTSSARAYLGPASADVTRRGLLLLAALDASPLPPRPAARPHILMWLASCWMIALDQITVTAGALTRGDGR